MWDSLLGGTGTASDWDETNLTWERIYETLDLDSKVDQFTDVGTWVGQSTTEVDLDAIVHRAAIYGDANGDGVFDANGMTGDIEAFHLAVVDWSAYVAEYGPRANDTDDLTLRNDGGYADGDIDSDDVDDFFRRHGVSRGDFNQDGSVDALDWSIYQASYGTSSVELPNARFGQGDATFDGFVNEADFDVWNARQGETGLVAESPELMFWLRPADTNTLVYFTASQPTGPDGPTLSNTTAPDLVLNEFTVDGDDLRVDYSVLGEGFTNVTVKLYRSGAPGTPFYTSSIQSGALGSHSLTIAPSYLASVVATDTVYAKVEGTPNQGTQSNTSNDTLDFEFTTSPNQVVNSLDDAGMDNLRRDKHTLRELLEADAALGWYETITFDESLFADGPQQIILGDIDENGTADQLVLDDDIRFEGPGADLLTISGAKQTRVLHAAAGTSIELDGLTVADGFASGYGGGLYALDAEVTVSGSHFTGNQSTYGGGICYRTVHDATASLDIADSTFSQNITTGVGAGIFISNAAGLYGAHRIANTTISTNNGGTSSSGGGGVYILGDGNLSVEVTNSTIAHNRTNSSGHIAGLWVAKKEGLEEDEIGPHLDINNTILVANISATHMVDLYVSTDSTISGGHNMYKIASGALGTFTAASNENIALVASTDAKITELGYYGGTTPTHALLPNSPAIGMGDNAEAASLSTDQRSGEFPRQLGDTVDIGAFESPIYDDGNGNYTIWGTDRSESITLNGDHVYFDTLGGLELPVDFANANSVTVYGAAGDDIINVAADFPLGLTVYGGEGADQIFGSSYNDLIYGDAGADVVFAGDGNDEVYGGEGGDVLYGGNGSDAVYGNDGYDTIDSGEISDLGADQTPTAIPNSTEPFFSFIGNPTWQYTATQTSPAQIPNNDTFVVKHAVVYPPALKLRNPTTGWISLYVTDSQGNVVTTGVTITENLISIKPPENTTSSTTSHPYKVMAVNESDPGQPVILDERSITVEQQPASQYVNHAPTLQSTANVSTTVDDPYYGVHTNPSAPVDSQHSNDGGFPADNVFLTFVHHEQHYTYDNDSPYDLVSKTLSIDIQLFAEDQENDAVAFSWPSGVSPSNAQLSATGLLTVTDIPIEAVTLRFDIVLQDSSQNSTPAVVYLSVSLGRYFSSSSYQISQGGLYHGDGRMGLERDPNDSSTSYVEFDPAPGISNYMAPTDGSYLYAQPTDPSANEYLKLTPPAKGTLEYAVDNGGQITWAALSEEYVTPGILRYRVDDTFSGDATLTYHVYDKTVYTDTGSGFSAEWVRQTSDVHIEFYEAASITNTKVINSPDEPPPVCPCDCTCGVSADTSNTTGDTRASVSTGPAGTLQYSPSSQSSALALVDLVLRDLTGLGTTLPLDVYFADHSTLSQWTTLPMPGLRPELEIGSAPVLYEPYSSYIGLDASELSSGYHQVLVRPYDSAAPAPSQAAFNNATWFPVLNQPDYGFGEGWNMAGLERLIFIPGDAGAASIYWMREDGYTLEFPVDGGSSIGSTALHDVNATQITEDGSDGFILTDKFQNKTYFDDEGWITQREDAYGNTIGYGYIDNTHKILTVTSSLDNHTTTFNWDGSQINKVTDYAGRVTMIHYGSSGNSLGRIVGIEVPDPSTESPATEGGGPLFQFTYDEEGRIASFKDAELNQTSYSYKADGQVVTTNNPDSTTTKLIVPLSGLFSEAVFSGLKSTSSSNYPIFRSSDITSVSGSSSRTGSYTDELGRITYFEINSDGFISKVTDPTGSYTEYERNAVGQPTLVESYDAEGNLIDQVSYSYDSKFNQTGTTYYDVTGAIPVAIATTGLAYDSYNRPLTYTDELGRLVKVDYHESTEYGENAPSQVTTRVIIGLEDDSASGENDDLVSHVFYLSSGLVDYTIVERVDSDGSDLDDIETHYLYTDPTTDGGSADPLHILAVKAVATVVDGDVVSYAITTQFDAYGNAEVVSELVEVVNTLDVQLSGGDLTISSSDDILRTTNYDYNRLDMVTEITLPDPNGTVSGDQISYRYEYTPTGRIENEIQSFDGAISGDEIVTHYEYDARHRVTDVYANYKANQPATEDQNIRIQYEYDDVGNVTSIIDPIGRAVSYDYDLLNRPIRVTEPDPDDTGSSNGPLEAPVSHVAYDSVGRLLADRDANGNVTRYGYDALHRSTDLYATLGVHVGMTYDLAGQLTSSTDAEGGVTRYEYDDAGRVLQLILPGQDSTPITYEYDTLSNVRVITDQLDRDMVYEYDDQSRLERSILNYVDGVTSAATDEDLITSYTYYADGMLASVEETIGWDGSEAVTRTTSYEYDGLGRLSTVTLPHETTPSLAGSQLHQFYDSYGRLQYDVDQLGNVTEYQYDKLHRLTRVIQEDPDATSGRYSGGTVGAATGNGPVTTYRYDAASQLLDVTDPENRVSSFEYDQLGRVTTAWSPDVTTAGLGIYDSGFDTTNTPHTSYTYDSVGNVLTVRDAGGDGSDYDYDALHRLISETSTDPTGGTTTYAYDLVGNLTTLTDPVDNATTWTYDELNRVVAETNELGYSRYYTYDDASRLTERTDRNGRTTEYYYDNLDRLTNEVWVGSSTQNHTVSPINSGVAVDDAATGTGYLMYSDESVHTRFGDNNINNADHFVAVRFDSTAGWQYNNNTSWVSFTPVVTDRIVASVDFDSNTATSLEGTSGTEHGILSGYLSGNLEYFPEQWNGATSGVGPEGEFDITGTTLTVNAAHVINYSYDHSGRLLNSKDSYHDYSYTYDTHNQLTERDINIAGLSETIEINSIYDTVGRLSTRRTFFKDNGSSTADALNIYGYDNLHRLTDISQKDNSGNDVAQKHVTLTYNRASQLESLTRYAGTTPVSGDLINRIFTYSGEDGTEVASTEYNYDAGGRLDSIEHWEGDGSSINLLAGYGYTFDNQNRLDALDFLPNGVNSPYDYSAEYVDYDYDDRGQLTDADYTSGTDESYSYDENGNRLSYTTDDDNRLEFDGTYHYTYDHEGNRTARFIDDNSNGVLDQDDIDVTLYTWDHRNRLVEVSIAQSADGPADKIVSHIFDAQNNWIRRVVSYPEGNGNADITVFVHDGGHIVMELEDSKPYDDEFETFSDLTKEDLSHRYLWGPSRNQLLVDEAVESLTDASQNESLFALADHLGTVRDLVDQSGTLRKHTEFDSYGNITGETFYDASGNQVNESHAEAVEQLFGYTGHPLNETTDLNMTQHRPYEAATGGWLSQDPTGFDAGDVNLYRYVGNKVTGYVDPDGLEGWIPDYLEGKEGWIPDYWQGKEGWIPDYYYGTSEHNEESIIGAFVDGYVESAVSGRQASSLAGEVDGVTDSLNPFGGGTGFGPQYGHCEDYESGKTVGHVTGFTMNAVMTVSGMSGTVTAINSLRGAGGAVQVAQLAVVGGGYIEVVFINGQAVVLTAELAAQLGITAAATSNLGNAAANVYQATGGGSSGGVSSVWPKHHPFPKYLGGAADQTLKKIPRKLHYQFHSSLDKWMNCKYARAKGAGAFKSIDRKEVIRDLTEFYKTADGGIYKKYLNDFLQAVKESGY
ncbi:putative deoxyribonuclease RhsB [Aeoliella mucimassa]|uniref:Putative deoxyribonuclease RhsB n=1 Tax=Aeoliella mucimassa TaxID=2527972 RepID=A0A518AUZ2_9BACT|nr:putative deoxyribonuclease RhsB [Aeoliella mucimassa]